MNLSKLQLEQKCRIPVYVKWQQVPKNLYSKTALKERGVVVPADAKPDAIKGSGREKKVYFLYNIKRFQLINNYLIIRMLQQKSVYIKREGSIIVYLFK